MKQCPKCNASLPEDYRQCDCGYEFNESAVSMTSTVSYASTYNSARTIAQLVSVVGWVGVGIGALLLVAAAFRGGLFVVPALGLALAGFLLVGVGQFTRAAVDTADYAGEILTIMKLTQRRIEREAAG